jgi:hypothetical protein
MNLMKISFRKLAQMVVLLIGGSSLAQEIPLPEHPRPDFQRTDWQNLNGTWMFVFDQGDVGLREGWADGNHTFDRQINVPFPWGSKLSGVDDLADIAWYRREIMVDPSWKDRRVFVTVGASDWETSVWIDGTWLGTHQGGYVPFSFELTDHIKFGSSQQLIIRVDDARRDFTLYGKQGYGNARGIWQTIYLEARGKDYFDAIHFTPDIDREKVQVTAFLPEKSERELPLTLKIETPSGPIVHHSLIPEGKDRVRFEVPLPGPRLWTLDDPYLYEVEANLGEDVVRSYFGMRKISVVGLPGTGYPYIALNGQPLYMQLTLDQSYHPDGFYTFPSDRFMKDEILRSKSIGLNGIRTHIKVDVPRKLYWADKLGLLVMSDLPNSWGEPGEKMQAAAEFTLREMIKRDYNHPAIFSWVVFNETWGLLTTTGTDENGQEVREYLPETQQWVASMYRLAKSLDLTRPVEDNSICCGRGHTETDINSWHAYLPGWEWEEYLKDLTANTFEGSTHNFEKGFRQGNQPNINSECGNVWGYEGSTGDVDWSWDYHRMINTFRKYPKVAGWLYTEHHDVINEWNGYWRFDRSEKETGLGDLVDGMTLKDLHAPVYLSTGNEICRTVKGGSKIEVPLWLSSMTGEELGPELQISYSLVISNSIGETGKYSSGRMNLSYSPWMQKELEPLSIDIPDVPGVGILQLLLSAPSGKVLHRNFMLYEIVTENNIPGYEVFSTPAGDFSSEKWSLRQWDVMDGRKVNGTGAGYFQYTIRLPEGMKTGSIKEAWFLVEASAKEYFVKDQKAYESDQDFMLGSQVAPSANPNAYPMTDETRFPSRISVSLNGQEAYSTLLPDDPADHRGILSWHHQLKDGKLREAGSYGYLVKVPVSKKVLKSALEQGELQVRIQTEGEGGIAIYGKEFGRYPLDPSLVLKK